MIKAKLLSGAYYLQTLGSRLNQYKNSSCPMCDEGDEDIRHFMLYSPALESTAIQSSIISKKYLGKTKQHWHGVLCLAILLCKYSLMQVHCPGW
jgi:hypothetical protein